MDESHQPNAERGTSDPKEQHAMCFHYMKCKKRQNEAMATEIRALVTSGHGGWAVRRGRAVRELSRLMEMTGVVAEIHQTLPLRSVHFIIYKLDFILLS